MPTFIAPTFIAPPLFPSALPASGFLPGSGALSSGCGFSACCAAFPVAPARLAARFFDTYAFRARPFRSCSAVSTTAAPAALIAPAPAFSPARFATAKLVGCPCFVAFRDAWRFPGIQHRLD
ncbi:MAG: hypothetical protein U0939_07845 [Pirellulales bacterium]